MSRLNVKALLVVCAASILGMLLVAAAIYLTFFRGRTSGPDFISAVQGGQIGETGLESVEVIVPPQGYDAFSESEYASLRRISTVNASSVIAQLLAGLSNASRGRVSQNHPTTIYRSYWKVNLADGGFYYLYVTVLQDSANSVCYVDANTRGATNPNGATLYHIVDFLSTLHVVDETSERQLAEHQHAP